MFDKLGISFPTNWTCALVFSAYGLLITKKSLSLTSVVFGGFLDIDLYPQSTCLALPAFVKRHSWASQLTFDLFMDRKHVWSIFAWRMTLYHRGWWQQFIALLIKVSLLYKTVSVRGERWQRTHVNTWLSISYAISELCSLLLQVSLDIWKQHFKKQGNGLASLCRDHHSAEQREEHTRFQLEWNSSLLHPVFTISTKRQKNEESFRVLQYPLPL